MGTRKVSGVSNISWEARAKGYLRPMCSSQVHTYCRHFAAAVFVEFVATCLTSKAMKQKLKAEITKGQVEVGLPDLPKEMRSRSKEETCLRCHRCNLFKVPEGLLAGQCVCMWGETG